MAGSDEESIVKDLLESIGVSVNGNQSYDIQLHDNRVYQRVLSDGALGLGESYMDGWWENNITTPAQ
jgi:cyclopropane-fatty-acyl-phospholipid synthase